ncbi:MAG: hypothetical protein PUD64_07675 [Bacteroidales bacterium]|nr:hypothetical protein [Bacteroidales bacterium]
MFYNILEKEGASIFDTPSYDQRNRLVVFRHIPHIDISGGSQHVNVLAAKVALAGAPKLHIFRIVAF